MRNRTPLREPLPARRRVETIKFDHIHPDTHHKTPHLASFGYYHDGRLGEIFIDSKKQANDVANLGRDAAVILSIALQYGVPVDVMQAAVGRTEEGLPHTVIGTALDLLLGQKPIESIEPSMTPELFDRLFTPIKPKED